MPVLQWTRIGLTSRRRYRDIWLREQRDKVRLDGQAVTVLHRSAIKSVITAMNLDSIGDETWGTGMKDAEGFQPGTFPWVVSLWVSELRRTYDLIKTYPGHESLWYHLRFVYYGLRWLDCEMDSGSQAAACHGGDVSLDEDRDELFDPLTILDGFSAILSARQNNRETQMVTSSLDEASDKQQECAHSYMTWVLRLDMDPDVDAKAGPTQS
ncbi:hypothetical protein BGX31_007515 [Mortierella sp. GBA43]|nr:hypothetical protein BGX31_007515 [Mortierella sp. GBA43]